MNCWNSLVEVIAGTGAKTGISRVGASGGPTPLVTGFLSRLMGCSGLLGPTVLSGTFPQEREPCAISAEQSLLLFNWASPNGLADPLSLEQLEL